MHKSEKLTLAACNTQKYERVTFAEQVFKSFPLPRQPKPEMEKRADNADISVLFFGGCANFLAVYAQTN